VILIAVAVLLLLVGGGVVAWSVLRDDGSAPVAQGDPVRTVEDFLAAVFVDGDVAASHRWVTGRAEPEIAEIAERQRIGPNGPVTPHWSNLREESSSRWDIMVVADVEYRAAPGAGEPPGGGRWAFVMVAEDGSWKIDVWLG